jgi:hypothetical protein
MSASPRDPVIAGLGMTERADAESEYVPVFRLA